MKRIKKALCYSLLSLAFMGISGVGYAGTYYKAQCGTDVFYCLGSGWFGAPMWYDWTSAKPPDKFKYACSPKSWHTSWYTLPTLCKDRGQPPPQYW